MARTTQKLNPMRVRALKDAGRHSDGNGLYLNIGKGGGKSWIYIYYNAGKRVELGLGPAHAVTLAQAREKAQEAASLRAKGIDPKAEWRKVEERQATFGEVALDLISGREAGWKNAKHRAQWRSSLETYAKPIWDGPAGEVSVDDVLTILRPIWTTKPETASRVRGRIETVLDAAKVRGLRSGENPAAWRGNLALLLPKPRKGPKRHHPAMPYTDVPAFMVRLKAQKGLSARALELLIHTATRTSEVLGARWNEFDMDRRIWTIPASRMKGGKAHRVPLTDQTMRVLEALPRGFQFLFPSARDSKKTLSNMAMAMVLQRMNLRDYVTVHGFRSSFRDFVHERTDAPREIAEQALSHHVGSEVERAYMRSDGLERRRTLMAKWSEFASSSY